MVTDDGPREELARRVRRFWFHHKLGEHEQDAVITPAYEKALPTNAEKRELRKEYERRLAQ